MSGAAQGSYAIGWDQVSVDGVTGAAMAKCRAGLSFRWRGRALRLDGPQAVLALGMTAAMAELRRQARRAAGRLLPVPPPATEEPAALLGGPAVMVTDGKRHWRVDLVPGHDGWPGLAHFPQHPPPAMTDLWISGTEAIEGLAVPERSPGVLDGLLAGTPVDTPQGPRPVETIGPGMEVLTTDRGVARVVECRVERVSGARLCAMPASRPVRLRAGALGRGQSSGAVIVGPDQGLVIDGPEVRTLFPGGAVVVAARDLADAEGSGRVDGLSAACLVALVLDRPASVVAGGLALSTGAGAGLRRIGRGEAAILLAAITGRVG